MGTGKELVVMVDVDTKNVRKNGREVLEAKIRMLARRLKFRTSTVAFYEMFPIACAGSERQTEL